MNDIIDYIIPPYNPSKFQEDLAYLQKLGKGYTKQFIEQRFFRNKDKLGTIPTFFVKTFITKQSNVYFIGASYPDWETEPFLKRRLKAILNLEKYVNLNGEACLWMYLKDSTWQFKALHSSNYIKIDDSVIVRVGVNGDNFIFKYWINGYVYRIEAKDWTSLPADLRHWNKEASFKVLPFSFFNSDVGKPVESLLKYIEKILSSGFAWGDLTAIMTFLNQLWGSGTLSNADLEKVSKSIGLLNGLPFMRDSQSQSSELKVLSLGEATNQENWIEFIVKLIKVLAFSEGIDISGWLENTKVGQSGESKKADFQNVVFSRKWKLPYWEEWDSENQELMLEMGIIKKISNVVFAELVPDLTKKEKLELEKLNNDIAQFLYQEKIITKIQYISRVLEIDEAEAITQEKRVLEERGLIDVE